jgi:glycosyltransferase involved in cell wall biosynthesis
MPGTVSSDPWQEPADGDPNPLTTVILPALNEESAITVVLGELAEHLGDGYEIIVVDDGSNDRTATVAEAAGARVIRHQRNLGKGAAMASGVEAALGDTVIFMDADATYPASAVPRLAAMLDDYDIVRGERPLDSPNIPTVNRLGNRVFNRLLASFHELEGHDIMSGLYGMSKATFRSLHLESSGFDIEVEIGIKARQRGLTLGTMDIDYHPRLGEKKLKPIRDGLNIMGRVAGMAILYSPTITFVIPGILIMALGLVGAIALGGGPVFIGAIGLSINSFVLAVLGFLAGFQLIVLGVAATLYRIETGATPARWLLKLATRPVRLGAAVVGLITALVAAIGLLNLVITWFQNGAGEFLQTERLLATASFFVFGLQLLSAGLFLSIFSGRLLASRG